MTTKYFKTTGIKHYHIDKETYCKMIDVVKLVHHEYFETEDKNVRDMLDRMEMRLSKNAFILPENILHPVPEGYVPGRYAIGFYDDAGVWHFYKCSENHDPVYTRKPCDAKMFLSYREAQTVADFLDEDVSILDFEENLSEEERWLRDLNMPFPYDADLGNEESVPVKIVSK